MGFFPPAYSDDILFPDLWDDCLDKHFVVLHIAAILRQCGIAQKTDLPLEGSKLI
jgi:hypothetical protein